MGARGRLAAAGIMGLGRTLAGGIVAAVLAVALVLGGLVEPLELASLNLLFEIRGTRPPTLPIVIVTIDEESFDELNLPWPFPRSMHGDMIDRISRDQPFVIAVDVIFSEPSPYGPDDDVDLGAAVARAGTVVLGAARTEVREILDPESGLTVIRENLNAPQPVIRQAAAAVAPVNLIQDDDGRIRRAPIMVRMGDEAQAGFDTAIHRLLTEAGVATAPLPETPSILINFRGPPKTFPWVPYYRVLRGDLPADTFRDAIVLIGPTSPVLHDVFATPFARGGNMPGVEIHANVIETLVRGDAIREVPRSVSAVVVVVAALVGAALVVRLHALRAFAAAAVLWGLMTVAAFVVFTVADVWLRGMAGSLALVLGYGATVVDHFVREQREKRRLSQFFSPAVLREVIRHRDDLSLASSRRVVTVLFSDIRGFTSISERVEPEQVAEMLREYLSEMTEVVFRHGGTVDKYIGDCIMALYNAPFEDPEHAIKAVRTGLDFQERTLEVSARWEARLGVRIRNGVGINTGEAVVGTMGSRQRLEYTAIGDTVNLAARLESLTKEYGVSILISEDTHALIRGHFLTRELGAVRVKGKARPVRIFAVLPGDVRKHPRAALDTAAWVTAVGTDQTVEVRTLNVGEGGFALAGLPAEFAVDTRLLIRCEGGGLPRPIAAEATVVWRRDDLAGVRFAAVDAETAPVIADYLGDRRTS